MIFDESGDRLGWGTFNTEVQALNSIHHISLIYEYPLSDVSISSKERNIVILAKSSTTTTSVFERIRYSFIFNSACFENVLTQEVLID